MALWNGLGQAATVAQLAGVDAGGLISKIIQPVQTVRRNREECRQLVHHVMIIGDLLQLLQQSDTMQRPEIRRPLDGLEDTLRQAYMLVTSCQQSNILYRLFMAENQAQKFRDVRDRIDSYLRIYPLISHIDTRYFISGLYSHDHPSGSGTQPQASEEVMEAFTSHTNPDSRTARSSSVDNGIESVQVQAVTESSAVEEQQEVAQMSVTHCRGSNCRGTLSQEETYVCQLSRMADVAPGIVGKIFRLGMAIKAAVEIGPHFISSTARWMADVALGIVGKIFRLGMAIKAAVETVGQQNEEECKDVEALVAGLLPLLLLLQEKEVMNHPATVGVRVDLERSMDRALELVTGCQKGNFLRRFFASGEMSRQLLRMQRELDRQIFKTLLAVNLDATITLTRTIPCGGAHPARTHPQDEEEMETIDCPRSGVNTEVTVSATVGSKVSNASSSRVAESSSPELEAIMQQFSELDIDGEGRQVFKQKIVIRVSMTSEKARSKAMELAARADGVSSLGITGDGRDWLEVVGEGVDTVCLLNGLRKKIGYAEILQVEAVKEKKKQQTEE